MEVAHRGASSTLSRMFKLAQECSDIKSKVASSMATRIILETWGGHAQPGPECSSQQGASRAASPDWERTLPVKAMPVTDSEPIQ